MRWRTAAPLALALAGCPGSAGIPCGDAGACPTNDVCIYSQCLTPSTLLQNLSAVVSPNDVTLARQQYLPSDLVPVNGYYVIGVLRPQTLVGSIILHDTGCELDAGPVDGGWDAGGVLLPDGGQLLRVDAGYPILLQFDAPTLIPSVTTHYEFTDNGPREAGDGGAIALGVLPTQFALSRRITTHTPCLPPFLGTQDPIPGLLDLSAPGVLVEPALSGTALVLGEVAVPPEGSLDHAAVRILGVTGPYSGQALSGDGALLQDAGALTFSLPIGIQDALAKFVVEIGPSLEQPDLPTFDFAISAPALTDAGRQTINLTGDAGLRLPIPLGPGYPITVQATDVFGYLPSTAVVEVASTDGGLFGCDGGCAFATQHYATPMLSLTLLPGDYVFTLDAPPPDGPSTFPLTVLADGGLLSRGSLYAVPDGGVIPLVAVSPQHVRGTVVSPGSSKRSVVGGQAEVFTLPDLNPVALAGLDAGAFDLLVPPGQNYLLLIEPTNGTAFPNYFYPQLAVDAGADLTLPPIRVSQPGPLQGVVRLEGIDGGFPTPLPNAVIQFYFVTSDPYGQRVAFPAASAVTDDQGYFSALGPAAPGG